MDTKECFSEKTLDGQLYEIYLAAQAGGGGGGGGSPTGPAGGDLNGTYPNPTVDGLQGRAISSTAPTAGQVYQYNGTQWVPVTITPSGAAGGDLNGTYPNPTVDGLQGYPISTATPYAGQVLQFDGTNWVPGAIPTGGSGGGGVFYYLNFGTAADAPVVNIPQTPNTTKELGLTFNTTPTSYTSATLSTADYDFLGSFVTDLNVPFATSIPAGIWDFNIFAESTSTNNANQIYFKIEVFKYDGVNAPSFIAKSNDTYVYDPTEITQYISSVVMPQTTLLATDRLVVYLYGRAHQNNNTITFHFGNGHPSHTHTTMPSVTGTGIVKVVNGVYQSPASLIVNADVSASAAIEVSKLSQNTNKILGRTTAGTGAVEQITVGTGLSLTAQTLSTTGPTSSTDVQVFTRGTLYSTTATAFTSGSNVITVASNANMVVGMAISAPFLPSNTSGTQTTITNIAGTTITVSSNATYNYSDRNIATTIHFAANTYTWTKPTGAKSVDVLCIAGGGGGSSGRVNAGVSGGGGGAGGGLTFRTQLPASLLSATESVIVGIEGVGGTGTNQVNSQNIWGGDGFHTYFGAISGNALNPWVYAAGGGGGNGNNGAAGSASSRNVNLSGGGGAGGSTAAGAGGGSAPISGAGGGGGGGANSTSFFNGGSGQWVLGNNLIGGIATASGVEGTNGSNGTSMNSYLHSGGGGAGGVGAYTKNAGAGGNGGLYGGGGGGGGCQGTVNAALFSGAGGNGAQGIVIVTTYF